MRETFALEGSPLEAAFATTSPPRGSLARVAKGDETVCVASPRAHPTALIFCDRVGVDVALALRRCANRELDVKPTHVCDVDAVSSERRVPPPKEHAVTEGLGHVHIFARHQNHENV